MRESAGQVVVHGLTKDFGPVRAVNNLSFSVEPGSVTGFLGPNGAGKTTTLRMLLGLVSPTAGVATIGGRRYVDLPHPLHVVGAVLEASSFHPQRTGRNHLAVFCAAAGLPTSRADETLAMVGMSDAGRRKVKGYSLGMRQRLALACAMLGDPGVLILDEPANGLDPEGIAWLRRFLRGLADQGRTVLVSSHVLTEMQQVADRAVIVAEGQLVRQGAVQELIAGQGQMAVVNTPHVEKLAEALTQVGAQFNRTGPDELRVVNWDAAAVGRCAFQASVELHGLRTERTDLEQLFLHLTSRTGGPQQAMPHVVQARPATPAGSTAATGGNPPPPPPQQQPPPPGSPPPAPPPPPSPQSGHGSGRTWPSQGEAR